MIVIWYWLFTFLFNIAREWLYRQLIICRMILYTFLDNFLFLEHSGAVYRYNIPMDLVLYIIKMLKKDLGKRER